MSDTIFALSSGRPPAAIAVVRISGPDAFAAVERLAGAVPPPRRASLRTLRREGAPIDQALILVFPGPTSATGENLAEFHLHGGLAVVRAVESALAAMPGLRGAEAGEFTRRALANGRIDLTQAEGLADLLAAESEGQRRAAKRAADGAVRRQIEDFSGRSLAFSARVEAVLDHGDEADVAADRDMLRSLGDDLLALAVEIETLVERPGVERIRDGIRVVLAGAPNAGKSTLLNALVQREAAIVSPIAGTTRDRIEAPVMRNGIAYLFTDTAGLHDAPADMVEQIGIDRARAAIDMADLVLWLDPGEFAGAVPAIAVHSRADDPGRGQTPTGRIAVSAHLGTGLDALWSAIEAQARNLLPGDDVLALNLRQRELAAGAAAALRAAAAENDLLLIAERLREALRAFDRITGRADVEAMLDALFGRFCIGK